MWSSAKSPRVPRLSRALRYDVELSSLRWNQRPACLGIAVQLRLESVSSLGRNSQLYRFLVMKSPEAAQRAIKAIRSEVRVLASQPEIGRPLEDMAPEFREWLVDFGDSGYVALYRYDGQTALILAIRHQKEVGY